jgi:hypothetical protein
VKGGANVLRHLVCVVCQNIVRCAGHLGLVAGQDLHIGRYKVELCNWDLTGMHEVMLGEATCATFARCGAHPGPSPLLLAVVNAMWLGTTVAVHLFYRD